MHEYKMLVSADFKNLWDALLRVQFDPTEENKAALKKLDDENTLYLSKVQHQNEIEFVNIYDKHLLEFIKSISKKHFLVGKSSPFTLSWNIMSDDNDDYWTIIFHKGSFHYEREICGGYGGSEILEKYLTQDRVKELLNSKS